GSGAQATAQGHRGRGAGCAALGGRRGAGDQGEARRRHRRDPRRDRRGAGVQRRGLREVLHPEGRRV
ncbi:MAG: Prokaryotic ubiquitin-like protein Pup, partial [uncultured Nocardioidaceae bacterium]